MGLFLGSVWFHFSICLFLCQQQCFDYCSFVVWSKVREYATSGSIVFKDCFSYLSLCVSLHVKKQFCSSSLKNATAIFDMDCFIIFLIHFCIWSSMVIPVLWVLLVQTILLCLLFQARFWPSHPLSSSYHDSIFYIMQPSGWATPSWFRLSPHLQLL